MVNTNTRHLAGWRSTGRYLGEAAYDDKPKSNVIGADRSIFGGLCAQRLS